jgi:hypothetical protein
MRSRSWDLGDITLPDLLGLLGATDLSLPQQQDALRQWMDSAAYIPAPEYLKNECRAFLEHQAPEPVRVRRLGASVPEQQRRWQDKLDRMFPAGAVCTWITAAGGDTPVPVSWLQVSGLSGLDPVLTFYHPFGWAKTLKTLTSLETVQAKPHLIATAKFSDGSSCQLTAAIPDGLKDELARSRAEVIAGNPLKPPVTQA